MTLELEPGSDPPRGQILVNGEIHAFTGWIGLAAAIERATEPTLTPRRTATEPPRDN